MPVSGQIKIVVIADIHHERNESAVSSSRRTEIADILFLRAVHRINRMIRPDITVILGDIQNAPTLPDGLKQLEQLRETASLLKSPWLIIPGNHDVPPDQFYSIFPKPDETTDLNGVRLLPFLDPDEPGLNAARSGRDLTRMRQARAGWHGQIITLQHVPVFPPGRTNCPYNHVNADEIIKVMRQNGIVLAISGHYHDGFKMIDDDGLCFLTAPALCKPPFSFLEIDLAHDQITVTQHDLRLPEKLNLWDMHTHTQFAYCSENMNVLKSMRLAQDFGLAGLTFTEHSGQLYFDNNTYWSQTCLAEGIASAQKQNERMESYLAALNTAGCRPVNIGLEVDCCYDGRLLARPPDCDRVTYLLGSIHGLAAMKNPQVDPDAVGDEFLAMVSRLVRSDIDVLAHPFRVFSRSPFKIPESLYDPVIGLLKKSGVAAEINFHTQTTDPEFVRRCLAAGVKLAFGSDAHNLYEIGEFAPHLALLRDCGFDGDLNEILLNPGLSPSP